MESSFLTKETELQWKLRIQENKQDPEKKKKKKKEVCDQQILMAKKRIIT